MPQIPIDVAMSPKSPHTTVTGDEYSYEPRPTLSVLPPERLPKSRTARPACRTSMDEAACCPSSKCHVAMSPCRHPVPCRNPLSRSAVRGVTVIGRRSRCRQEPSLQLSFKGREWTERQAPSPQHHTSCFTLNEAGTESMRIRYRCCRPEFQGLGRLGTPSRPLFRSSSAHFSSPN